MTEIPQAALRARQRYADGDPVDDIVVESNLAIKEFYHWLDGAPQPDGTALLPGGRSLEKVARILGRK